ncbi:MAG: glycosyltransferase family 2 protein [Bacteroidales bacterium]|nr:glycosyltransferase family 2 protein [Bacteroidales bacterium]
MNTAVVILNWNGQKMLERFLPSVIANTEADIIVADNGSTDNSVAFMQECYPSIPLILLDKNYGFAEGYNRALSQLPHKYFLLLNNDVECTPNWLTNMERMMDKYPDVAIIQPKIRMFDDRERFEYAGAAGGFIDKYGYPFCRGRLFNHIEKDNGQYDDECEIFWATGAAMMVRADVWRKLSGFDSDFFAHMEEIDFCWRAKNSGCKVMYCPNSVVVHVGGGTLPKSSPFKAQLNFRNNLAMLYKNLPQKRLHRVIALRMLLDGVAALKFLLEGHPKESQAVAKAHRAFRKMKPSLKEKRKKIVQIEVSRMYKGLLLFEHYLLRRTTFSALPKKFS